MSNDSVLICRYAFSDMSSDMRTMRRVGTSVCPTSSWLMMRRNRAKKSTVSSGSSTGNCGAQLLRQKFSEIEARMRDHDKPRVHVEKIFADSRLLRLGFPFRRPNPLETYKFLSDKSDS